MLWGGRSGWLTGNQIVQEYSRGHILIEPFDASNVNSNSYNYRLAPVLHRLTSSLVDCRKEDDFEVIEFGEDGFILMPGELYLGTTIEEFGSTKFASLVTGKSSVGRKFITNHITAGLIDQGFKGSVTLEIVVRNIDRPKFIPV